MEWISETVASTVRQLTAVPLPDPPPSYLFEPQRIGIPPEPRPVGAHGLRPGHPAKNIFRRIETLDVSAQDVPALNMHLGPMCYVSVTGCERDTYSFDLKSEVACDDERQAEALLQGLSFKQDGGTFVLRTPPNIPHIRSRCYLDVLTPADRALVITGTYSAVEICGMEAAIVASTAHGSIALFNNVGRIDAQAREGGSIVFVGNRGQARLDADIGIDVKLTELQYDGSFEAVANGLVRVLIPREFATGLQVDVSRAAQFVHRTESRSRFRSQKTGGRVAFVYGSNEQTSLRFASRHGAVVIDAA